MAESSTAASPSSQSSPSSQPSASSQSSAPPIRRPYFIPESVDYESLPGPVRYALGQIVGTAYVELVERAHTVMERSMGVTIVFLYTMEVLDQFAAAQASDLPTLARGVDAPAKRDPQEIAKRLDAHLRLVMAKQSSAKFLHRLQRFRDSTYHGTLCR